MSGDSPGKNDVGHLPTEGLMKLAEDYWRAVLTGLLLEPIVPFQKV